MTAPFSSAFVASLGPSDTERPAAVSLFGLEQEFQVWDAGARLDFRDLIHDLGVPGRRLDPGDINAYRLANGLALTCDGAEAEFAIPPLPVGPGFTEQLEAWAGAGNGALDSLLPATVTLSGYSTHLSVSMPDALQGAVISLFARTFAPVFLIHGQPDGYGPYVRPRPNRIELCLDYLSGGSLRSAALLFAGGVRACLQNVIGGNAPSDLPPTLAVHLRPARGRFGVFVGRHTAFGFDPRQSGALLPLAHGGTIRAEQLSAAAQEAARSALAGIASEADFDTPDDKSGWVGDGEGTPTTLPPVSHWLGEVVHNRYRPTFTVKPVAATWDFTVFRADAQRSAFICLPRDRLCGFLQRLDAGVLDDVVQQYLEAPSSGHVLATRQQTSEPGLWDEVGNPLGLLAAEPDQTTGKYDQQTQPLPGQRSEKPEVLNPRAAKALMPDHATPLKPWRAGKPLSIETGDTWPMPGPTVTEPPAPLPPVALEHGRPYAVAIAGLIAAVIAIASIVFASGALGGGDAVSPPATATVSPTPTPPPAAETQRPSASSTPTVPVIAPATAAASPTIVSTPRPTETRPPGGGPGQETPATGVTPTPPPASPVATSTVPVAPTASPTLTRTPIATSSSTPSPTPTCVPSGPGVVDTCPSPTPSPTPTCVPSGPGVVGTCPSPTANPTSTPTPSPTPTPRRPGDAVQ